ncbi:MAG: transporter substrate-binding domain-containing protein [Alphaproteobacteria bacterium]|nr:transporter substrate-binding domain-containing protein [Alphaproteobacteria bacterium]
MADTTILERLMKRLGSFLAVAVLAVIVTLFATRFFTPSGQATPAKETVSERIVRTGTIRCGYSVWQPLFFIDMKTGEKKGIFHDLMEESAKRLNLKIVWQEELGWGTIVESVRTGRVDMACAGYWVNPARIKHVSSTAPQLYAPMYVWVRADDTRKFASPGDLNADQYTVAQIDGGSTSQIVANRFPKAKQLNLPELATNSDWIESLVTNKADFVIDDVTSFNNYMANNPGKIRNLFPDQPVGLYPAGMLLPPDDWRLKDMLDATLRTIEFDGTLDVILKRYDADKMFLRNPKPELR